MEIWLKVKGPEIHYLNRVLEGHEYLGVLTTLDSKKGVAIIRTTSSVQADVVEMLNHLPFQVQYSFDRQALFPDEEI